MLPAFTWKLSPSLLSFSMRRQLRMVSHSPAWAIEIRVSKATRLRIIEIQISCGRGDNKLKSVRC